MGRLFRIGDTEFEFDEEQMKTLNNLAGRFYDDFGYVNRPGFDYSASTHPMEQKMFILAVRAFEFHNEVGLE